MVKKEHKTETKKEHKEYCSGNVWMYICIGLGIAFLIALIFAISGATKTTVNGIGTEQAGTIIKDLMKTGQGVDANIISVVETNGLYKIDLEVQGQAGTFYLTLDGQNIILGQAVYKVQDVLKNINNAVDTNATTVYTLPQLINEYPEQGKNTGITVIEFSDFQCPFCGLAFGSPWSSEPELAQYAPIIGTVKKIENDFVKTDKILFKQVPVAFLGQESINASNASLCADEQDKYWEMHDLIFNANTKEENNGKYTSDKLKIFAEGITGLDLTVFNSCVDSGKYVSKVQQITKDATNTSKANTGSFGTPLFYIVVDASKYSLDKVTNAVSLANYKFAPTSDGKEYLIVADPTYSSLKQVLDALVQ